LFKELHRLREEMDASDLTEEEKQLKRIGRRRQEQIGESWYKVHSTKYLERKADLKARVQTRRIEASMKEELKALESGTQGDSTRQVEQGEVTGFIEA
jgi:hypothetical protein